ncbi:MAG: magnesium transporter CorA family protein [Leptospiraceae bacterium]|nr:magnesium transporter CorA family protein [Leptospiraceae bacterium]
MFITYCNPFEARNIDPVDIPGLDLRNHSFWMHIQAENTQSLSSVLSHFRLHDLTVEDICNPVSRIKLERFKKYTMFIFRGVHMQENEIHYKNFNFLLLQKGLITIALDNRNTIRDLLRKPERGQELLRRGVDFIIHRILDIETDHTLNIIRRIEDRVDAFEDAIYSRNLNVSIIDTFRIKRNLQHIVRDFIAHRDIFHFCLNHPDFSEDSHVFFRDVNDHSQRIIESVDSLIASISAVQEAYVTLSTRRMNQVMRDLTVLTAIMLPVSTVAAIFGMNFAIIPGSQLPYGFLTSVGLMILLSIGMFFYFKFKHWV